jgi:hypothetical protein
VNKLRSTGLLIDKKQKHKRQVLIEEKLDDARTRLEHTPRKSLKHLAQETGVSESSARRATQLLKLRSYKTTVIQPLQPCDPANRVYFYSWFLQSVVKGEIDPQLTFFSDEAWFHLQGYISMQNNRYWSSPNPHLTHEVLLHPVKVGVCLGQFFPELTEGERVCGWFQQDLATAHTSCMSMQALSIVFGARVISCGIWPACSPDLNPYVFFLLGLFEGQSLQQ